MREFNLFPSTGPTMARKHLLLAFVVSWLAITSSAFAQQEQPADTGPEAQDVIEDVAFRDNLGRDTPRSSFMGFLLATEKFDFELAVQFMDLRNLPRSVRKYSGEELARQLDFVIKRGMKIDVDLLSRKPNGQVVDGLPDYRDELGRLETDSGEQVLFLQKVPGPDDNYIWKISNASIALIPDLYDYFSYPDWVEDIRQRLPQDSSFLGIELFKWVIVLGVALLAAPVFWLIGFALSWLISKPGAPLHRPVQRLFTRPIPILLVMIVTGQLLVELGLGATAQKIVEARTLMTLVVVWLPFSEIDLIHARRR